MTKIYGSLTTPNRFRTIFYYGLPYSPSVGDGLRPSLVPQVFPKKLLQYTSIFGHMYGAVNVVKK